MKEIEIGYGRKNSEPGDYDRFRFLWTCPQAARKIIGSPAFKTYPDYIRESLEERLKLEPISNDCYSSSYPPIIGLPRGMEFLPTSHFRGEKKKTAEFIIKNKLVAIAVEKADWDKIKVPPGFITELSFKLLTDIPKK